MYPQRRLENKFRKECQDGDKRAYDCHRNIGRAVIRFMLLKREMANLARIGNFQDTAIKFALFAYGTAEK